jgi:hypothetical protein
MKTVRIGLKTDYKMLSYFSSDLSINLFDVKFHRIYSTMLLVGLN